MSDPLLVAERLEQVLAALERIPRRFVGIATAGDLLDTPEGRDRVDAIWILIAEEDDDNDCEICTMKPMASATPPAALEAVKRILTVTRPERIVLFGSWARGEATPDSDLDLLVVMPFHGSRVEATLPLLRTLANLPASKDVIVLTPQEWEASRHLPGTVAYPADQEGIVLHAA